MAFLLFLFLYHLLLLLLPNLATSKCPESFQCGDNFALDFPFTDINNPKCGLFTVEGCTDSGKPVIRSQGSLGGYQILGKISTNKIKVFNHYLYSQSRCFPLMNISLPKSPSISFTIPSNLTLFTCSNKTFDRNIHDYFKNYLSFYDQGCGPFTAYYLHPTTNASATEGSNIPADCGMIQLPIDSDKRNSSHQLFDLLTAGFILEWSFSEDCYNL